MSESPQLIIYYADPFEVQTWPIPTEPGAFIEVPADRRLIAKVRVQMPVARPAAD